MGRLPKTGRYMVTAAPDIERSFAQPGPALSFAQNVACRCLQEEGSVYVRDWNDEVVYRVDRSEDGNEILTWVFGSKSIAARRAA